MTEAPSIAMQVLEAWGASVVSVPTSSTSFVPGVSTPASDPNVTAVGGGNLIITVSSTTLDSAYVRESAYGDPQAPYDIYGIGQNVCGDYWGAGGG